MNVFPYLFPCRCEKELLWKDPSRGKGRVADWNKKISYSNIQTNVIRLVLVLAYSIYWCGGDGSQCLYDMLISSLNCT